MSRIKFLLIFVLLALLLSAGSGMTMAQEPPLEDSRLPNLPGLDDPVSEWTDDELEQLVDLIVSERITVQQSQVVYEQLTEEQRKKVGELLAARAGIPLDEWQQLAKEQTICRPSQQVTPLDYPGEIWRQTIEYQDLSNGRRSSYYISTPWCDDKPDDDWTFYFYVYYAQDPDGLRWYTTSSRVFWAFMLRYQGNLNGYAFAWDEARLCIGTWGVDLAGGPDQVNSNLYLRHN